MEEPSDDPEDGTQPHAQTVSDQRGFYELELETGDYWVCTSFRRCVDVTIEEQTLLQLDYEFGAGPGWE